MTVPLIRVRLAPAGPADARRRRASRSRSASGAAAAPGDAAPPDRPLVLDRLLAGGSGDTGNVVRAVRSPTTPGGIDLAS